MEKIIKLEDFNNKSLDDIIELYRSGYILEGAQPSIHQTQLSSYSTQMQLPSYGTAITVFLAGALVGLAITLILRKRK